MKPCSNCQSLVEDTAAYCDMCGAAFPRSGPAACPSCGVASVPGEVYCHNCGVLLPFAPAQTPEPPVITVRNELDPALEVSGRFIVSGSNLILPFPGGKPELLVGRAEPDSRFFPDIDTAPAGGAAAGVSRRHAKLILVDGRIYIEDLGSTNFTFVNRQRLPAGQPMPLNAGDEVRLGRLVLLYQP